MSCALAQPCYNTNPIVEEMEDGVQRLVFLKTALQPTLLPREAEIIKRVTICSPSFIAFRDVFAMVRPDTGEPLVVFGYNALLTLEEVGQAIAIAQIPSLGSDYLENFVRYRASPFSFEELPLTAEEFATRFGPADTAERIQRLSEVHRRMGEGSAIALVLFFLSHELAHHALGHVALTKESSEKQKEMESKADAWAVTKIFQLGIDPAIASLSMLLLNELEGKSEFERSMANHPPPHERAIAIMAASERVTRERPEWIVSYLATRAANGGPSASVEEYREGLARMRSHYENLAAEEKRLASDNEFLLARANAGSTKDAMALAFAYAHGSRSGINQDWGLARSWMKRAASQSTRFEYNYRMDATYYLGNFELAPGGDRSRACDQYREAAAVKHMSASVTLEKLEKEGIC